MTKIYGLLLTIITGLFFLLGGLISLKVKNKAKLNIFSVSLAFIIILNLIFIDLFPEILENLVGYNILSKIILIGIFLILGIVILRILDMFIPDHHHEHDDNESNIKEHKSHVKHIGVLTIFSLVLHNIIEGFAIIGLSLNDLKTGILICISIALHNIPLGTHIFSSLEVRKNKLLIGLLTLSSLIGGLLYLIIGEVSNIFLSVILCITLGMLTYIATIELLPEILKNRHKKETIIGLVTGLIIVIISLFI